MRFISKAYDSYHLGSGSGLDGNVTTIPVAYKMCVYLLILDTLNVKVKGIPRSL